MICQKKIKNNAGKTGESISIDLVREAVSFITYTACSCTGLKLLLMLGKADPDRKLVKTALDSFQTADHFVGIHAFYQIGYALGITVSIHLQTVHCELFPDRQSTSNEMALEQTPYVLYVIILTSLYAKIIKVSAYKATFGIMPKVYL